MYESQVSEVPYGGRHEGIKKAIAFPGACLLEADSYAAASVFAHVVNFQVTKAFFLTGLRTNGGTFS